MTQVEKIHHEIDSAQDNLLKEANELIKKSQSNQFDKILDIAERHEKLGFTNTPTVEASKKVKKQKQKIVQTKKQADLIQYYMREYPFLKFLTELELDRICDKYNLVYAPVVNYTKDIPEKNLEEIENAKELNYTDIFGSVVTIKSKHDFINGDVFNHFVSEYGNKFSFNMLKEILRKEKGEKGINYFNFCIKNGEEIEDFDFLYAITVDNKKYNSHCFSKYTIESRDGLFIAAPKSHFNLNGLEEKGKGFFKIIKKEPKDPIVFRYVRGGVQVLSKWGDEANDIVLQVGISN